MASAGKKKIGGVKAHASPEQRARMNPADLVRADIQRRLAIHHSEITGIVNDILAEKDRGREAPDDKDKPPDIVDDGLA